MFHPHVHLHLCVIYFISIIHMRGWLCFYVISVSFHDEFSFASLNLIHVGCQKSFNRFCFIYLNNFILVMGLLYCKLKIHSLWSHIICVFKTSIQPNVIHFWWNIIIFHTDKLCFITSWKVSSILSILPRYMDSSDTYLTWVTSHIIQYAHSGNQALALEHIVKCHQAFLHPQSVSGCSKISTKLISNDQEKNITYWTSNSLGRRNLRQECRLQDGTLALLTCGMIIWKENTNELHLHNTIFANILIRERRWWALPAKFHCSQEDTAITAGFVMSGQIMRLHKVAICPLWEVYLSACNWQQLLCMNI